MANRPSVFNNEFFNAGVPAAGYKLYTYASGTTTPKATYTDQAGTIPNTNPITLDAGGMCELWLGSGEYTLALYTGLIGSGGALVKTWDDVAGAASAGELSAADALLRADLANATDNTKGPAMVGHGANLNYAAGTVGARLNEMVSVTNAPYLADKTAATNSSASIQAALTAQTSLSVPIGTFRASGLAVPTAAKGLWLEGDLLAETNNSIVLAYGADTSRAHMRALNGGGQIKGNSKTGVTGIKFGSTTNNPSAGAQEAVLYVGMQDVQVSGCETGVLSVVTMEHSWANVVLRANTTGLKLYSDPINGGGNANSFNALRLQSNAVGAIFKSTGNFPMHNNILDGALFQENTTCGFYSKGNSASGAIAGLTIRNFHAESNGLGAATVVVDGETIKRSDFHFKRTSVTLSDSDIASTLTPFVIAEDNSIVHAQNLTGYGNSTGDVFLPDSTSVIYESGLAIATGNKKIETYGFMSTVGSMVVLGAPKLNLGVHYRNDATMPNPAVPLLDNTTGVASVQNEWKSGLGIVSTVVFSAVPGSTATNRNFWYGGAGASGEFCLMSVILMSNANTTLEAYSLFDSVLRVATIDLTANRPRRLVVTGMSVSATGISLYLYPKDSVGAAVSFKGFQYLHTTDISVINQTYHEGLCGVKKAQFESCTPLPTTSGTPNGVIVWKPVAAAGASPGDINTATSGAPVWKALPAVAA